MFRALIAVVALLFLVEVVACAPPAYGQNPSGAELKIHITAPAYTGLPVWIQADLPEMFDARYPYHEDPGSFGPNKIELKREGQILEPAIFPAVPSAGGILDGSMAPPNSPKNRLPLHLMYSLDKPGTYSVRWTAVRHEFQLPSRQPIEIVEAQSDWLTFELKPSTKEQKELWLQRELADTPTDPGLVAGDFLPSLMSQAPDGRVLRATMDQLYSASDAVSAYALGCIYRFPDQVIRLQTIETISQKGPSERLAYFVSWRADLFNKDAENLIRAVLPFLRSSDDSRVSGALRMLIFLTIHGNPAVPDQLDVRANVEKAVLAAAPDLLNRGGKVTFPLAEFLGTVKAKAARDLLWQMAGGSGGDNGQALIALTWIADPDDLPRLGGLLVNPGEGNKIGGNLPTLVYSLMKAYGDNAIPYLEKAIADSPFVFVRLQSAEQLATHGSPIAFRFFLDTVNQNPSYKAEAVRWLRDQFPKDISPTSDDAAVVAFLKTRLSQ
jgi:hypothetical protein